jgi:hypothetical protein
MLDGIEPGLLDEIHHAAAHVQGIDKVTDAKARWIGHQLYVQITVQLDEHILLATANAIAERLRKELFDHLPALKEANVLFAAPAGVAGSHHAPEAVPVSGRLASGLLDIVDTPEGERMRLRVSRHAEGLRASVRIERGGRTETLELLPVADDHHYLESVAAPEEPHEFTARLNLAAGNDNEVVEFAMAEPDGHHH